MSKIQPEAAVRAASTKVALTLARHGHQALFAGGCVRDLLLGREPDDYDIATSATPEQIQELFPRTIPVGAQFGVVVVLMEGFSVQVATFRSDGDYSDGRHPEKVCFTDVQEDALRRDFTINGLFLDPLTEEILDYVEGRADLDKRLLRAIGDPRERFREDKLRLLRAIRFASVLDFTIEEQTWDALLAQAEEISQVSAERIREELLKMLLDKNRLRAFDLLDRSGLLRILLPEIESLKSCEQPPEFHPEGDVFVHTRLMLSLIEPHTTESVPLVLAVLFHDIGKPATRMVDETGRARFNGHEKVSARMTEEILHRLRFPNEQIDATIEIVRNHMAFKDVQNMRTAKLKRLLAKPTFPEELELHRLDCQGSHGLLDNYHFLLEKEKEFAAEPLIPPPLITGHDLIALGWIPGPAFRIALETVQTAQLEGEISTKEEALTLVRSLKV